MLASKNATASFILELQSAGCCYLDSLVCSLDQDEAFCLNVWLLAARAVHTAEDMRSARHFWHGRWCCLMLITNQNVGSSVHYGFHAVKDQGMW
jgi:hypothetical protein